MIRWISTAIVFVSCVWGSAKELPPEARDFRLSRNLIENADFESDWMHNQVSVRTRFLLLDQSDWGYAQSDGVPDSWVVRGGFIDDSTAKFGRASLRLNGEASQVVYLCGQTDPPDGGSHYNPFQPLPSEQLKWIKPRPLRVGGWCRTDHADQSPTLSVDVERSGTTKPKSVQLTFAKGTHEWEYLEAAIPPEAGAVASAAVVKLQYSGQGKAWFDGIVCEQAPADEPNLLTNGNFDLLDGEWPAGWSRAQLWSWSRREYYRFSGWSHENGRMQGQASITPAGLRGTRAMQLSVLPGDNIAVRSGAIRLLQNELRPIELSARVWAKDLRWMEIMAQDEQGHWLGQHDFSGAMGTDQEYRNRLIGAGSHDWQFVRKYLVADHPVRELTVWLCARGMDGKLLGRNVVGTVWFDDVEVREAGSSRQELERRGVTLPAASVSPAPQLSITHFDPGEHLWGKNEMRLSVRNGGTTPAALAPFTLILPSGEKVALQPPARVPAGTSADIIVPYTVSAMCADWQHHYRIEGPISFAFGTHPAALSLRVPTTYLYPDEKGEASININVARQSIGEVARLRAAIRYPGGERVLLDSSDVHAAMIAPDAPAPAMLADGYADRRNLVPLQFDSSGLTVHPWNEPVRDCVLTVTLGDRQGNIIASVSSKPFGVIGRPKLPTLPEQIHKTTLDPRGVLLVNDQPFFFRTFPVDRMDLGGASRLMNFPKTHRIAALPFPKDLVFKPDEEGAWKEKVLRFVNENKNDPKLFGYFFDHNGETSFWFDQWKQMADCQRKVAQWTREADPNHVIMSASWLIGHAALKPEAAEHFGFFDEIDEEAGLTFTADVHAFRQKAGRPIAVILGLEAYFYQSPELLRWRVYEAMRQGAYDVGICPSGMLQAAPETVTFLRGLYGEQACLEPMVLGSAPPQLTRCDNKAINLFERASGGARYIVAIPADPTLKTAPGGVRFDLPAPAAKVHVLFESRDLPIDRQSFTDTFQSPAAVHVYRVE